MKLVFNNLLLFLWLAFYSRYCDSRYMFTIGSFFHEDDSDVEKTLKCGVRINNHALDQKYRYKTEGQVISKTDTFANGKQICNTLQADQGLVSVFGPTSISASSITQAICENHRIPHIQFIWKPSSSNTSTTTLNLYPNPELLAKGLATVIEHTNWNSFSILYENEESLVRLQEVLKIFNLNSLDDINMVTVRQLGSGVDHRPLLKEIYDLKETQIILDCETDKILEVLFQAKEIGLLADHHRYFLTSLDAHTLDFSSLQTAANITTWRIVNPENDKFRMLATKSELFNCADVLFPDASKVRTREALVYDALELFMAAVQELQIAETSPFVCEESKKWKEGSKIVQQMKKTQIESPLTGSITFNSVGNRVNFSLQIVELLRNNTFKQTSIWNSNNPSTLNITISEDEKSQQIVQTLQQIVVKVSSRIGPPYLRYKMPSYEGEVLTGNDRYEGFSMDLITEISKILNFKFEFELAADGKYGNYDPEKKAWNGLIKDLLDRKAHLAICDLTITHKRREVVDFSMPFMTLGISILYKKSKKEEASMFAFLEPLSLEVWIYTATLYLAVSIMLYIIARMAPGDWENPHPCDQNPEELENIWDLKNCLWLTLGSIMTQGCDILPKGVSSRMASSMWWFFSLIMTSSYTANLAAFLTKERMGPTIDSAEALAKQTKIKYGTVDGGATQAFFKEATFPIYQRMWTQMQSSKPSVFEKSNSDGVKRVQTTKNQLYAFLMESSSIEYEVEKNCDLKQVGTWLDNKGYGIAMPVNSGYRDEINKAVLKLQEDGIINSLKTRWWQEKNEKNPCLDPSEDSERSDELALSNVGGVFLVLGIGVAVAFLLAMLEFLWNVHNVSVEEHITFWEALKAEVKFAVNVCVTKKRAKPQLSESSSGGSRKEDDNKSIARSILHEAGSFLNVNMLNKIGLRKDEKQ